METIVLTFEAEKETKNTVRYQEAMNPKNKMYVPKDKLEPPWPMKIRVRIDTAEG